MKVILPGARCDKLYWEFLELDKKFIFDEVLISVGTNYISDSQWTGEDVAYELRNFIIAIDNITPPSTHVTWMQILPKRGRFVRNAYLPKINLINMFVNNYFYHSSIGTLNYIKLSGDEIDFGTIICPDGTHLNYRGVDLISEYIVDYLALVCTGTPYDKYN
jgi:hypothetical protein